jgi:hypothetical protein
MTLGLLRVFEQHVFGDFARHFDQIGIQFEISVA